MLELYFSLKLKTPVYSNALFREIVLKLSYCTLIPDYTKTKTILNVGTDLRGNLGMNLYM